MEEQSVRCLDFIEPYLTSFPDLRLMISERCIDARIILRTNRLFHRWLWRPPLDSRPPDPKHPTWRNVFTPMILPQQFEFRSRTVLKDSISPPHTPESKQTAFHQMTLSTRSPLPHEPSFRTHSLLTSYLFLTSPFLRRYMLPLIYTHWYTIAALYGVCNN